MTVGSSVCNGGGPEWECSDVAPVHARRDRRSDATALDCLTAVLLFGFAVLGWVGTRIYQEMPPIPSASLPMAGN
jgi:hypothetical protein